MDEELTPTELDALRQSPRASDRASWHLIHCEDCWAGRPCVIGTILEHESALVIRAIAAFCAVPKEQRPLLLKDFAALEDVL